MSRIYPNPDHNIPDHLNNSPHHDQREVYTIWMKSLVLHGNGLTVYNSGGEVVYRVDNYGCKNGDEADLMDGVGNIVFRIYKKKLRLLDTWDGYGRDDDDDRRRKPAFRVTKLCRLLTRSCISQCMVRIGSNADGDLRCYRIEGLAAKSEYKIVDLSGRTVAEMRRKVTEGGVVLGNDILKLVVEPFVDRAQIMAMVVVIGLINRLI